MKNQLSRSMQILFISTVVHYRLLVRLMQVSGGVETRLPQLVCLLDLQLLPTTSQLASLVTETLSSPVPLDFVNATNSRQLHQSSSLRQLLFMAILTVRKNRI
jgi:hypothetical protein